MQKVDNYCSENTVLRLECNVAHAQENAQYSWWPVRHKHRYGGFSTIAFICITYKEYRSEYKSVTAESHQPCTILWMATDTATNVPDILFTHEAQRTQDSINNTSILTLGRSKVYMK